jgi:hypothetical protein
MVNRMSFASSLQQRSSSDNKRCSERAENLLATFDPLLLLAGVVQGTFFAGRVFATRNPPQLDGVYREVL